MGTPVPRHRPTRGEQQGHRLQAPRSVGQTARRRRTDAPQRAFATPLTLYGGTEIAVRGELAVGSLSKGLLTLGRWLVSRGHLDLSTPAHDPVAANDSIIAAANAYLGRLNAGDVFDFAVAITAEEDALVFEIEPADNGVFFLPRLARGARYAWRKRSYDLMVRALQMGPGTYTCPQLAEEYSWNYYEGATNDEEARDWLAENHGMSVEDVDSNYLPSSFRRSMPDVCSGLETRLKSKTVRPGKQRRMSKRSLRKAPKALQQLWAQLEVAIAEMRRNKVALTIEKDDLPPMASDRLDSEYCVEAFCIVPAENGDGPWFSVYDDIYNMWMQTGEERFALGISVARSLAELDKVFDSIQRAAEMMRALGDLFDYWARPPAKRADSDTDPDEP